MDEETSITILKDGPYLVKGLKNLKNSKGEDLEISENTALCRCGASNSKPFCDGTHSKIGFKDEKN